MRGPVSPQRTRARGTATRGVVFRERQEGRQFARTCRRRPVRTREGAAPSARPRDARCPRHSGRFAGGRDCRGQARPDHARGGPSRQTGYTASAETRASAPCLDSAASGNATREQLVAATRTAPALPHRAGGRRPRPSHTRNWATTGGGSTPRRFLESHKQHALDLLRQSQVGARGPEPAGGSWAGLGRARSFRHAALRTGLRGLIRPALWPTQSLLYGISGSL